MALTRDELATLLIFQQITDSWVREVHRFESMRKRRKHFVIFRDSNNRKITSLAELKAEGVEVDESSFKTAACNEIVSNKVGANKKARREVRAWTHQLIMGGEKPAGAEENGAFAAEAAAAEKALVKKVAAEKAAAEKLAAAEAAIAEKAAAEKLAAEAAAAEAAEKAASEKLAAEAAAAELAAADEAAAAAAAAETAAAPEVLSAPEVVTPVEEVAAQVEEVAVAVAAVLEEFATPATPATPAEAAIMPAVKPKGINLPTTELTDDWMDDDMGSINSEESEEEGEVAKEAPALVENASSDSEPEKETVGQEIFSLTEVPARKEESLAPAEA